MAIDLKKLGIEGTYTLDTVKNIPDSAFPVLNGHSQLVFGSTERVQLFIGDYVTHGSYGDIRKADRVKLGKKMNVLVKSPRLPEMNLKLEGIVQHLSHICLEKQNMPWAIPAIYDIYQYKGRLSFTMEEVHGQYLHDWFSKTKEPDLDFYRIMVQLSITLCILHNCLELDHRDLKSDNIFIRAEPSSIQFKQDSSIYIFQSPIPSCTLRFRFCLYRKSYRLRNRSIAGARPLP